MCQTHSSQVVDKTENLIKPKATRLEEIAQLWALHLFVAAGKRESFSSAFTPIRTLKTDIKMQITYQ